jgi:HlyD family secretion protein
MKMKQKVLAVILVGCMLFAFAGCAEQRAEIQQPVLVEEAEGEAYPTTTAEYGDVVKNIRIYCSYTSTDKQELAFPVDNKLIEYVSVKRGDYVDAGQLLASLDVEHLEESIEEMEYQIAMAELKLKQTEETKAFDLQSAETMFGYTQMTNADKEALKEKKEAIEEQYRTTLEDMNDSLAVNRKRLQSYKDELDAGKLFADISGEITYVEDGMEGTYCTKDRVVVTVSNRDACYFIADDATYAECFKEGQRVEVDYVNGGKAFTCEVVPERMDEWSEQMFFKPVNGEMIASSTMGTIVVEYGRKENVLCVPTDAVHESDNGLFVYLENNGLLGMRYVTVGLEGDTLTEITEGLEQGEIIALKK